MQDTDLKTKEKLDQSTFRFNLLPEIDIVNEDLPEGRVYYRRAFPSIRVPSVTTLISRSNEFDFSYLEKWKAKVGKEVAEQTSTKAKLRGTAIHKLCEDYIYSRPLKAMPINLADFQKLKPILDSSLEIVYGIEHPLFSEKLGTAGRTDLIAQWNGLDRIIDFKTSKRKKKAEDIEHYFVQMAIYALLIADQHKKVITEGVIIVSVYNDEPQVFEVNLLKYMKKAMRVISYEANI